MEIPILSILGNWLKNPLLNVNILVSLAGDSKHNEQLKNLRETICYTPLISLQLFRVKLFLFGL